MAAAPGERLAQATASSPREQVRTLGCAYVNYAPENRGTLVAPDGTVPSVAQRSVRHDLGARVAQVRWTSTACLPAALQCHRRGRSAARGRAGRARGPAFRVRAERSDRPRDRRPRPRRAGAHAGPDRPALTGAALPVAASTALLTATFLLQDVRGQGSLATGLLVLPLTGRRVAGGPLPGLALRRW
ncbi:hypothetical protein ACIPJK_32535 [Streptomyces roseus]|uniref:hypothetical protein n=1 Tax=Streptomyces roseus TaxID=66430 RepID=UPI003806DD20